MATDDVSAAREGASLSVVNRVANSAARRITLQRILNAMALDLTIGLTCVVLMIMASQRTGFSAVLLWVISNVVILILLIVISLRWRRMRCTAQDAAVVLDDRLGLHESLSTSMAMESRDEEIAQAQRLNASALAESLIRRRGLATALPIRCPRNIWWPLMPLAILSIVMFMHIGSSAVANQTSLESAQTQASTALKQVSNTVEASTALPESVRAAFQPKDATDALSPEEVRREAIRELTSLRRSLHDFDQSPSQRQLDLVRSQLANLPVADEDDIVDARRALGEGNFSEALSALRARDAAMEESSADGFDQLADDLDATADAMQSHTDSLVDELEEISSEQRDAAAQSVDDQEAAADAIRKLADECRDAAKRARDGASSEDSSHWKQASQWKQQQDAHDQSAQCQSAAEAACAEAMASGEDAGDSQAMGMQPGQGGQQGQGEAPSRGRGVGGGIAEIDASETLADGQGFKVDGVVDSDGAVADIVPVRVPRRADAVPNAPLSKVIDAARQRAAEGIDLQRVPRRYRDVVAAWFASLPKEEAGSSAESP